MKKIFLFIPLIIIVSSGCQKSDDSWFLVTRLDDRTYIISEPRSSQGNSCFLLIGDREAILFDSGSGEQKAELISSTIDSLASTQVTLLFSHFHFDHIGNAGEFKGIGLPGIPYILENKVEDGKLQLGWDDVLSADTGSINIAKMLPIDNPIDLGNRQIEILHTPGHSKESITIIDHESRYIFSGDLLYNGLLLINDCDDYISSLEKVLAACQANYRVFGSHGIPEMPFTKVEQTAQAMECFKNNGCKPDSVRQIDFFGSEKKIQFKDGIAFLLDYADAFKK